MEILRTPDERFDGPADYPFEPHYVEITEHRLRVHCPEFAAIVDGFIGVTGGAS